MQLSHAFPKKSYNSPSMDFSAVNADNLKTLYQLNRQLATEENQAALFTADLTHYAQGFIGNNPVAFGTLCFHGDEAIGFAICNYKFATYLGFKVLHIEDIYLEEPYATKDNKQALLTHLINQADENKCARIEMRVLNDVNWGTDLIESLGFKKIDKWSVYRKATK